MNGAQSKQPWHRSLHLLRTRPPKPDRPALPGKARPYLALPPAPLSSHLHSILEHSVSLLLSGPAILWPVAMATEPLSSFVKQPVLTSFMVLQLSVGPVLTGLTNLIPITNFTTQPSRLLSKSLQARLFAWRASVSCRGAKSHVHGAQWGDGRGFSLPLCVESCSTTTHIVCVSSRFAVCGAQSHQTFLLSSCVSTDSG